MADINSEKEGEIVLIGKILNKIRETRKERKVSQQDIAKLLGISTNSYNEIENGKRTLSLERFLQITQFLEMDEIFGKESTETKETQLEVIDDFGSFLDKFKEQSSDVKEIKENQELIIKLLQETLKKNEKE